ncbi:hypothetical protein Q7P35_002506 [Cladosporium inversicolor]
MCNNKSLPPVGYAQKLLDSLAMVNDPSAGLASDSDIETAARDNLPVDNDFLAREAREVGKIAYSINVLQTTGVLIDRMKHSIEFEYDEIFKAIMSRRVDRPSREPTEPYQDFIKQWLNNIDSRRCDRKLALEDMLNELRDLEFVPQSSMCFTSMIRDYLPAQLDLSSWIGEMVKQKLLEDGARASNIGELITWQPSMGQGFSIQAQRERVWLNKSLPFMGRGGDGRLVWREDASSVHTNIRPEIPALIEEAERSLVTLSIQISNWLAWCIFKDHADPMARIRDKTALTSGDIIQAVVEILGDAWFELPFDDDGLLKQWKFERAFPWNVREYLNVADDHHTARNEDKQFNEDEGQGGDDYGSEYGSSNYLNEDDL